MEKQQKEATNAVAAEVQRERTISVTKAMLEDVKDAKFISIVTRLIEQSDAGTTGKTIWTMAKMLRKQEELEIK